MPTEEDINFLEAFRSSIERFLIVGTAPTMDRLWGGSGLIKMEQAMKDPEFRDLRRTINQAKGRAALILEGLGIGCTFHQHPPPAVGGPTEKFPLFDLITDNRSHHTIDGTVFTDKLDEAIGLLRSAIPKAAPFGPAAPILRVRDIARALEFYERQLGFTRHQTQIENPGVAIVERGTARILLQAAASQTHPPQAGNREGAWNVHIYTYDSDALMAEFENRGTKICTPLADNEYELCGFSVTDPDGYVLLFAHPISDR